MKREIRDTNKPNFMKIYSYNDVPMVSARGNEKDIIINLNQKGKTFFLITHDIGKGFENANRIGILSNGQIVYETERGEKKSFLEKYNYIIKGETI